MTNDGLIVAIKADPNDPEDFDVSQAALDAALADRRRRLGGRPKGSTTSLKQQVTLRLDRDVLDRFKAGGTGWQTRINDVLREASSRL